MDKHGRIEISYWRSHLKRAKTILGHKAAIEKIRVERRSKLISEIVSKPKNGHQENVLELGCGTGTYSANFAKNPWTLTAIDIVPEFISLTKRRVKLLRALNADARNLPFNNNSFDAVIGNAVLHHIIPLQGCLSETFRVLKPGGRVVFTEPNMINPHIFLQKNILFLKEMAGDSPEETAFIRWRLAKQLKKQGFINVKVEPFDFLYPFMPISFIGLIRSIGQAAEKIPIIREFAGSVVISAEKPKRSPK